MRFRVRHPNGECKVVEVDPHVDGLERLKSEVAAAFSLPPQTAFQLLDSQHPPQPIGGGEEEVEEEDTTRTTTLAELGVREPQVLLISQLAAKLARKPSTAAAAAKAAASKQQQRTKRPAPAAAAAAAGRTLGGRVHTLASSAHDDDGDDDGEYESQDDDDEVRPARRRRAPSAAKSSKKPKQANTLDSLGESLASAHAPGAAAAGGEGAFFRKLTKANVKLQYEIAASEARFSAVVRGDFEIFQSSSSASASSSSASKLLVKYRKGSKSYATEEVQGMDEELLRATISNVLQQPPSGDPEDAFHHPREKLRPHALPMASPRVFWNLVHWATATASSGNTGESLVPRALMRLVPDQDWSFLDSRVRLASELGKAAKRTELAFKQLEEREHRETEQDDELHLVVPNWRTREALRARGVRTILQLANQEDCSEEDGAFVSAAREHVVRECMLELFPDAVLRARIVGDQLGFRTPLDVKRWSVPGRAQFVQRELADVTLAEVQAWQARAQAMVDASPWLALPQYKTSS